MHNGAIMASEVAHLVVTGQLYPVVRLTGVLDAASASDVRSALHTLLATRASSGDSVRVDLSRVDFCDSSGIAAFVDATHIARAADVRLQFQEPSPSLRRLFAITGVDRFLDVAGRAGTPSEPVASTL